MHQIIRRCFTIILLLGISSAVCAQVVTGNQQTNRSMIEIKNEKQGVKAEDITVLKAQITLMKEFNQNILSTVYWSLGTIVIIAILLIGYSWFTNYKLHERELSSLKQELTGLLNTMFVTFTTDFNQNASKRFNEILEKSIETAKTKSQEAVSPLKDRLVECENDILQLQFSAMKSEANYWELKGVKGNELTQYRKMLALAIRVKNEFSIGEALDFIQRLLAEGAPIYHAHIADINELLDLLPPKYSVHMEAIRNVLKTAKSY